jgi:dTDP-glucose 4,6-dehydratase
MLSDKAMGEVINIGSNFEVSVGEMSKIIADIMHIEIEIVSDEVRLRPEKSEVERLWADNSKALKLINWSPKYAGLTGFRSGLSKTIDWFSNPENLKQYKTGIYNL